MLGGEASSVQGFRTKVQAFAHGAGYGAPMAVEGKTRTRSWLLLGIAAAVVLAVLTQHALVEGIARLLADLWVSTVSIVLKLFVSIFGGH